MGNEGGGGRNPAGDKFLPWCAGSPSKGLTHGGKFKFTTHEKISYALHLNFPPKQVSAGSSSPFELGGRQPYLSKCNFSTYARVAALIIEACATARTWSVYSSVGGKNPLLQDVLTKCCSSTKQDLGRRQARRTFFLRSCLLYPQLGSIIYACHQNFSPSNACMRGRAGRRRPTWNGWSGSGRIQITLESLSARVTLITPGRSLPGMIKRPPRKNLTYNQPSKSKKDGSCGLIER